MKKLICILLTALLLLSACAPAFAAQTTNEPSYVNIDGLSPIPIITISGDGDPLYDTEGNKVLYYKSLLEPSAGIDENKKENIKDSVINVLEPFLKEGVLNDSWDNYYAVLQKEISELFADSLLDKNGEASNGTDISPSRYATNESRMKTDMKRDGGYVYNGYYFYYDWRLDPLETADKLNEYIKAVKKVTNSEKVCLLSRCIGTSIAMAYVSKYGMDDIHGIGFNGSIVNGAEVMSESISGKFKLDLNAINRFLKDCEALNFFDIDAFITKSIDLLDKNGVFDAAIGITKDRIYYKLLEGVTSALALSTFFTWPSYWTAVSSEDYQDALYYVFGAEGSAKRIEYAGLIEKLDRYDREVRQQLDTLYDTIAEEGNICIMSKYGYQIGPICESCDEVGDQFASVRRTSLGATVSTVYDTLSKSYINSKILLGQGKYISPDKQIDASSCKFPDNTWFVKGSSHSNWTYIENNLLLEVISADRQLTTDDFPYTQFLVWDNESQTMSAMTEENCDTLNWTPASLERPSNFLERIYSFMRSLLDWLVDFMDIVKIIYHSIEDGIGSIVSTAKGESTTAPEITTLLT